MEDPGLPEKRVQAHRCLWEQNNPEAAQLRLVLKLRSERGSRVGNMVPFDRWPHAAGAEGTGR
jgi:hypothetical protein